MAVNEFGVDLPDIATSTDSTKEITVQAEVVEADENTTVKLTITKPKEALGTANSVVLVADDLMDGLQVGYGIGSVAASSTVENDHSTAWAKYTTGMATVGTQSSSIDLNSADEDRLAMAISLAVNENMSISYGISDVDFETASKADEESSGFSASYTMGGMTFAAVMNQTDAVAGSAATDRSFKELSVAFAF